MALFVTVYLSLMGPEGLREVNELSAGAAHYLKEGLLASGLFEDPCPGKPFLKEFALKPKGDAVKLHKALLDKGFFAALPSEEGYVLFCATEKRSKEEIDNLIKAVKEAEL